MDELQGVGDEVEGLRGRLQGLGSEVQGGVDLFCVLRARLAAVASGAGALW